MKLIFYYISNIVSIIGLVTIFYQIFRYMSLKKYYKEKIKLLESKHEIAASYVINFSGNKMVYSEDNWLENKVIIDIPPGNIHNLFKLEDEVDKLIDRIDPAIKEEITSGKPFVFVLPGMSSLAQIIMVKLHALTSAFPLVSYAVKDENGYVWRKPVDLQIYRTNNRSNRLIKEGITN